MFLKVCPPPPFFLLLYSLPLGNLIQLFGFDWQFILVTFKITVSELISLVNKVEFPTACWPHRFLSASYNVGLLCSPSDFSFCIFYSAFEYHILFCLSPWQPYQYNFPTFLLFHTLYCCFYLLCLFDYATLFFQFPLPLFISHSYSSEIFQELPYCLLVHSFIQSLLNTIRY